MLSKKGLLNGLCVLILASSSAILPGISFAEPEAMGRVTSIFPESGVIVIDGQKYMVSDNVRVSGRVDGGHKNPLAGLKSGMTILYGGESVEGRRVVSDIVVTGDE